MSTGSQSHLEPLLLHTLSISPNPLKVAIALELLHLPYTIRVWQFGDDPIRGVKSPAFARLTENQRAPVLQDPNTGVKVWESGAIINYLRRWYDLSQHILGPHSTRPTGEITEQDRVDLEEWEQLLLTTAAPMTGQVTWFLHYHQPSNPDALKRYKAQVFRCYDVLEGQLGKSGGESVLSGGVSSADCHWHPWLRQPGYTDLPHEGYPMIAKWVKSLSERAEFRQAYARVQEAAELVGLIHADLDGNVVGADLGLLKAIGGGAEQC